MTTRIVLKILEQQTFLAEKFITLKLLKEKLMKIKLVN